MLPFYNSALTIASAVQSVLQQSYNNFELLLINDGSNDSSVSILQSIMSRDRRMRLTTIPRSGVAHAFNVGIQQAKGKYIARMDSDDAMLPDRLEKQLVFLEQNHEVGVVSCLVEYGGDRRAQEGYARHVDWINTLISPEDIALNRFIDSPVCNPSVMFRNDLTKQHVTALSGDFPEDYEMWLRWMDAGVQFAKIPETLFVWNDLPTRLTRNDERYTPEAFERAKTKYLVNFIRQNDPQNRSVYLCGTGRITRKKSRFLLESGITIGGYIGIDEKKSGMKYEGIPVIGLQEMPDKMHAYVVNYVSVRGAREELRKYFLERNFREGNDFVMAG